MSKKLSIPKAIQQTIALGGTVQVGEPISTVNAWGFDGWVGHTFSATFRGINFSFESGMAGTRHQGTIPVSRVRVAGIYKPFTPAFFVQCLKRGADSVKALQSMADLH